MSDITVRQALAVPPGVELMDGTITATFEQRQIEDSYGMVAWLPSRHADYTFKAVYKCSHETWLAFEEFLQERLGGVVRSYGILRERLSVVVTVEGYAGRLHFNESENETASDPTVTILSPSLNMLA